MSPTIAEAAQDYHDRRKWKPVPISRKTKKPIGKKWQERPARPLAVLQLRAWARARLWQAGEFDLQTAVDALQEAAAASELTAAVGQDAVQRILADAFRQVSDDGGAT